MLKRLLLTGCLGLGSIHAQSLDAIPAPELGRTPTAERIASLVDRAATQGWGSITPALWAGAQQAYETNTGYASQWYYLYRWSRLLGTPYQKAIQDWIKAVEAAGVAHANMASSYPGRAGSLAAGLSRDLLITLLGDAALSEEFFQLLSPVDNPVAVLAILEKIHREYPTLFVTYGSLALAIAVVDDVPPAPHWPHAQVSAAFLPRQPAEPEKMFLYLVKLDRAKATKHRLTRLPASELKFLVDVVAPFAELDWARKNVPPGLADLGKAYDLIQYRQDRITGSQYNWPGPAYTLPTILAQGGICVDQAYFASAVGKAKGIPTIMFRGAGLDGRHAWFGYLDAQQRWQLDCGRYAEQKFVTGLAFDPQTWGDINDRELLFIAERFRALPTYRLSVMHAEFAGDFLREGKVDAALAAARESVNRDRRNVDGWDILLAAQAVKNPGDLRGQETILREAMRAFGPYPDVEIQFSRRLVAVLRQRGETSLAAFEEQRLGRKYLDARQDLTIGQAAAILGRSMQADDLATQIKLYNRLLDTFGRGGTIDYYDNVVVPFIRHLAGQGQVPAALQCLDRASHTLRVEPGGMLDTELKALEKSLRHPEAAVKPQ